MLIVGVDLLLVATIAAWPRVRWRLRGWLGQPGYDPVRRFLPFLVVYGFHILAAVLALVVLGVPASVLGAILSAAVAVGVLSDAYAGTNFLLRAPFRVGDMIEIQGENLRGTVQQYGFSSTILHRRDGGKIIIPNRKLSNSVVMNASRTDHWLCYVLKLQGSLGADAVQTALESIVETVSASAEGAKPQVVLTGVEEGRLRFAIRLYGSAYEEETFAAALLKLIVPFCASNGVELYSLMPDGG